MSSTPTPHESASDEHGEPATATQHAIFHEQDPAPEAQRYSYWEGWLISFIVVAAVANGIARLLVQLKWIG